MRSQDYTVWSQDYTHSRCPKNLSTDLPIGLPTGFGQQLGWLRPQLSTLRDSRHLTKTRVSTQETVQECGGAPGQPGGLRPSTVMLKVRTSVINSTFDGDHAATEGWSRRPVR